MKFSVLLPTRNGLTFLKYSIISVLRQSYTNWEIIISDNASDEDIASYVHSLNDSRILYSRSEQFLSVTENWNICVEKATGDYIIMLGDDDILLKNYFQILLKLIQRKQPDLIYTNAFVYAYPHVHPDFPKGLFHPFGSLNAMPKHKFPFQLDLLSRTHLVKKLLEFEPVFGTNMQHALIHRSLINKIKRNDRFFYSPYPDFYAMCALFLNAERAFIYPEPLVVIGITPKSHGYYFYNKREKEGLAFLNIQKELDAIPSIQSIILPAQNSMLTFWLGAMELLNLHFPLNNYGLTLNYQLYRKLQTQHVITRFLNKEDNCENELQQFIELLSFTEQCDIIFSTETPESVKWFFMRNSPDFKRAPLDLLEKIYQEFKHRKILSEPRDSSQYVMLLINPIENIFLNALEIFEQYEPLDLSPHITIVITTFKRPQLLKRAVESVLNQTHPYFQLCVYDNFSDDETESIMNELIKKDSRIEYYCHSKNIGMIENYRFGYERIATPYFCFLSDDDYFSPWFLETALKDFAQYPEIAFSACAVHIVDASGKNLHDSSFFLWNNRGYFKAPDGFLELTSPYFKPFTPTCTLFSKHIIGDIAPHWNAKLQLLWDPDYLLQLSAQFPFVVNEKICGYYTSHENGFSSMYYFQLQKSHKLISNYLSEIHRLINHISELSLPEQLKVKAQKTVSHSLMGNVFNYLKIYMKNGSFYSAISLVLSIIKHKIIINYKNIINK